MVINLIEPSRVFVSPLNVCTDTCNIHVSVPMGDKYLVELLKNLSKMDKQKAVLGFEGMHFEMTELPKEKRLQLSITGDSKRVKLCKVVF